MMHTQPALRFRGHNLREVAILDDTSESRDFLTLQIEEAGFKPVPITTAGKLTDVIRAIKSQSQAAICDHRLTHAGLWAFAGADVVANLNKTAFPALLVTQFVETDKETSIRPLRENIPVLLARDSADSETLRDGLKVCVAELSGSIPAHRVPHPTLIRIVEVRNDSEPVVDAIIPAWNPRIAVRFPLKLIPGALQGAALPGARFFAKANVGAHDAGELFFKDFSLAPLPDDKDGLA